MKVVRLSAPGLYIDDGGLYLQVTLAQDGTPRKSWLFRYSIHGRPRHMGLGPLAQVSLAEARAARDKARAKIRDGIDPIEVRHTAVTDTPTMTFDQCAAAYLKAHEIAWRNVKHRRQWPSTLAAYVSPVFGALPASAVDTDLVMRVLAPLWKSRPETASRVRGRIESVLAWATVRGFRSGANPAQWRHHLDQLLPPRRKVRPVRHMPALPYAEVPALMARLREINTVAARALMFTILTAARSGEVTGATWREIDIDAKVWTIPAARMKAGRSHRVPLSDSALAILMSTEDHAEYVFPGERAPKMASVRLWELLKDTGAGWTVHGMRSTFRDFVGEETSFPREIAEAALAHAVGGAVEQAYRRGDALSKRRALMEAWAVFCEPETAPDVI